MLLLCGFKKSLGKKVTTFCSDMRVPTFSVNRMSTQQVPFISNPNGICNQ